MTIVDLSYARDEPKPGPETVRSMALAVKGWAIGWALFEGEDAKAVGCLKVKTHFKGEVVPSYRRVMGVFTSLGKIAGQFGVQVIVSSSQKTGTPLWTTAPLLALMLGNVYGEIEDWETQIGKDFKELRSWATLLLGKPPSDDLEVSALGIGAVAAAHRTPNSIVLAPSDRPKQTVETPS